MEGFVQRRSNSKEEMAERRGTGLSRCLIHLSMFIDLSIYFIDLSMYLFIHVFHSFISFDLISSHSIAFISLHFISLHLTSLHFISFHFFHVIHFFQSSIRFISFNYSLHFMSFHFISERVTVL